MKRLLLLLLLIAEISHAQSTDSVRVSTDTSSLLQSATVPKPFMFTPPTVGLGVGLFSFYGDVYSKHFQSPSVGRIASELYITQSLSDYFTMNFYVLFGKLGANERLVNNNRNVNFESQIRAGGFSFQYNFGHLLPADRTATPFISLGIESFEFLSKTDALDQNGNAYYYWTDGTIRNLAENDPAAATAVELKRDYTYESDIREMNLDNFGKYTENSFALPIGIGAEFKINDYIRFKLGTVMHYTFTDYIDGITFMSKGNRQGNNKNDKFMMTSCSIGYNFGRKLRDNEPQPDDERYKDVDFLALDTYDYDKDGVADPSDSCQCTPIGVTVDSKGCPIDDDLDNYANYKDNELISPPKAWVDIKGVQLSDSAISDKYERYTDESLKFAEVIYRKHKGTEVTEDPTRKLYSVSLGTFQKGLPADLMTKFLSIPDIKSYVINDSTTMYTAGTYNNLMDVNYRRQQLANEGINDAKVVFKQYGRYSEMPEYAARTKTAPTTIEPVLENQTKTEPIVAKTEEVKPTVTETITEQAKAEVVVAKTEQPAPVKTEEVKPTVTETITEQPKTEVVVAKTEQTAPLKTEEVKPIVTETITEQPKTEVVVKTEQTTPAKTEEVKPAVVTQTELTKPTETKTELQNGLTGNFEEDWNRIANDSPKLVTTPKEESVTTKEKSTPKPQEPVIVAKEVKAEAIKQTPVVAQNSAAQPTVSTGDNALNVPGVVLRVQLGAYKKPLSKKIFRGIPNVVEVKTEDGLYKYMSGAFNSFDEAAKHKLEMNMNGYPGAFITAYKDGKRISLKEAGATPVNKNENIDAQDNVPVSTISKDLVKFKVQLGVFKNQPPDDKLAIFAKLKDVVGEKTNSGLTKYVAGSFATYKEADAYKNEIIKVYGITDPFVVATFNNEYISIQEAIELQK